MNVNAGLIALAGAAVGGVAGLFIAKSLKRPAENPLLVGAALGAIVGASVAPSQAKAATP